MDSENTNGAGTMKIVTKSLFCNYLETVTVWTTYADGSETREDFEMSWLGGTAEVFRAVVAYHVEYSGAALATVPEISDDVYQDQKARLATKR
jgi:hypothetical protein